MELRQGGQEGSRVCLQRHVNEGLLWPCHRAHPVQPLSSPAAYASGRPAPIQVGATWSCVAFGSARSVHVRCFSGVHNCSKPLPPPAARVVVLCYAFLQLTLALIYVANTSGLERCHYSGVALQCCRAVTGRPPWHTRGPCCQTAELWEQARRGGSQTSTVLSSSRVQPRA